MSRILFALYNSFDFSAAFPAAAELQRRGHRCTFLQGYSNPCRDFPPEVEVLLPPLIDGGELDSCALLRQAAPTRFSRSLVELLFELDPELRGAGPYLAELDGRFGDHLERALDEVRPQLCVLCPGQLETGAVASHCRERELPIAS